jgi:hypothetical protein
MARRRDGAYADAGRPVRLSFLGAVLVSLALAAAARAEQPEAEAFARPPLATAGLFAGGALTAFAAHEACHLAANLALGNVPAIHGVKFLGAIPFFAISPDISCTPGGACSRNDGRPFGPGQHGLYAIQAAGLLCQQWGAEAILTAEPDLIHRDAPFLKGMLALDSGLAIGYAFANWLSIEPHAGDVTGNDRLLTRLPRGTLAAVVLVPAVLDLLRLFFPEWTWLPWTSRVSKGGLIGLEFAL